MQHLQSCSIHTLGNKIIKTTTTETRISKQALDRRKWKPFGDAVKNNNCTVIDQTLCITDPNDDINEVNILEIPTIQLPEETTPTLYKSYNPNKTATPHTSALHLYKPPSDTHYKSYNNPTDQVTVKVSNIPDDLTEKWLRTLGNNHGRVMRCKIPKNTQGNPLNFAFVSYQTLTEATRFMTYIKGNSMEYCILDAQITVR